MNRRYAALFLTALLLLGAACCENTCRAESEIAQARYSKAELERAMEAIDGLVETWNKAHPEAFATPTMWWIDAEKNRVIVEMAGSGAAELAKSRTMPDCVVWEYDPDAPDAGEAAPIPRAPVTSCVLDADTVITMDRATYPLAPDYLSFTYQTGTEDAYLIEKVALDKWLDGVWKALSINDVSSLDYGIVSANTRERRIIDLDYVEPLGPGLYRATNWEEAEFALEFAVLADAAPQMDKEALSLIDPIEPPPFYEVSGASGKKGLADARGELIYPCQYDGFSLVRDVTTNALTHIAVKDGALTALGTTEGRLLTGPVYDAILGTWNGKYLLTAKAGGHQAELWTLTDAGVATEGMLVSEGGCGFTQKGLYRHTILSYDDLGGVGACGLSISMRR